MNMMMIALGHNSRLNIIFHRFNFTFHFQNLSTHIVKTLYRPKTQIQS